MAHFYIVLSKFYFLFYFEDGNSKRYMNQAQTVVLLADDDEDDCFLFKEALDELPLNTSLLIVNNGLQLMSFLEKANELPDVLFLDMNMPCMNGLECLKQIRIQDLYKELIVIIYTTSYDKDLAKTLKNLGADFYIRKPSEFSTLKIIINKTLQIIGKTGEFHPKPNTFMLSED